MTFESREAHRTARSRSQRVPRARVDNPPRDVGLTRASDRDAAWETARGGFVGWPLLFPADHTEADEVWTDA